MKTRLIDFGQGPVRATQLTWGDVFTAWHTTGIPNIEDYTVFPAAVGKQLALMQRLRPLLALPFMRALLKRGVRPGPSAARRAITPPQPSVSSSGWGASTTIGPACAALRRVSEAGHDRATARRRRPIRAVRMPRIVRQVGEGAPRWIPNSRAECVSALYVPPTRGRT